MTWPLGKVLSDHTLLVCGAIGAVVLGDFTTGSDSTTSSPDSSRDAWVVDTSASEEQDSSEREAKSEEVGQAALSTKDRDFPPLQRGPSCEASFDDTPIQSRGHYVLPSEIPATAPVSTLLQTPAHTKELFPKSCMGPASKNGTNPVRDEGRWTAQNPSIPGRQRVPRGPDAAQNHSRVVVTATQPAARIPKKSRKGSVGDGLPTASGDQAV
ncbi:hypothetical protein MRX96_020554 [Rhipicephalus microplus]